MAIQRADQNFRVLMATASTQDLYNIIKEFLRSESCFLEFENNFPLTIQYLSFKNVSPYQLLIILFLFTIRNVNFCKQMTLLYNIQLPNYTECYYIENNSKIF